jgi:tetratricopeptide (TPR) repeat protein
VKRLYVGLSVLTVACVGLLAATKINDPDTMQYLASGRVMLDRGLDYGCVFSYATDACQIVYPQWLFHLLTYTAYRAGSWSALVDVQIAIAVCVFAVIVVRQRRQGIHPLVTSAIVLLAVLVARERFMLRADFFALLPAVLMYYALEAYFDPAAQRATRRRLLAALAAIQMLWANTHGSFYVAFLLLAAFLAAAAIARRPGLRTALDAVAAVALASFLNPYGLKSLLQPLRFLWGGERTAPQLEFLSPFAPADLEHLTVTAYKVLLAVAVALLIVAWRSLRLRDVLILAPLGYLSARGMRYIALFAVFCAAILPFYAEGVRAKIASTILRRGGERRGAVIAAAVVALLMLAMGGIAYGAATDRLYRFDATARRTGWGVSDLVYPVAAADFMDRNDLPGNVFNDYSCGTYLNWRFYPARKTFIDGHTYTPESLAYYRQVMAGAIPYQQVVDRFHVGVFFLDHKSAEARPLIARLYDDAEWALVYFDEIAAIFVKKTPENGDRIAKLRVDLAGGEHPVPARLQNVRETADAYLGHTDRGLALSGLGLDAEAIAELTEADHENPDSFVTSTALGLLLDKRGDGAAAVSAYGRALSGRPGYAPAHFWLGMAYLRQKRTDDGILELRSALRINRALPFAHYNLGAALENRGDKARAREEYREELTVNPSYTPAVKALHRLG